jgi:predicted metalloprotease with PDZ domain
MAREADRASIREREAQAAHGNAASMSPGSGRWAWLSLFSSLITLAGAAAATSAPSEPIVLVVDASRTPVDSIVHVHETLPVTPGTVDLAYPRWVPGEHGPNGPIQNITGLRVSAAGQPLTWARDFSDMNEFHIEVPPGNAALDVDFDLLGSTNGAYGEARLATATILAINWNQFLLYPQKADIAAVVVAPTIVLPGTDWIAETALPKPARAGNRVTFAPATLERLVDSPLDAGTVEKRFMLLDSAGFTNEIDAFADRLSQLELPAAALTGFKAMVGEMDAIYGARHWRNYHFLLTVSDAMPPNGVEHGSSSDDGNDGDGLTDSAGIIETAGLLAHEFNHSWDGKYRRPADLATNNFQVPEQTDLLWIYEGMTEYYGDLVPTRAGLWKGERFRDTLAGIYAAEDHEPGRLVRPLADTAVSAPFLYEAPRSLSAERRSAGDFYIEGELLWLDVTAKLGELSHGSKSLDGFCRRFFGIEDTPPIVNPYTYGQFVAALAAYQAYDWDRYFKAHVYSIAQHPPSPFEQLGWRLVYTEVPNASEAAREKRRHSVDAAFSLGVVVGGRDELSDVLTGSPAARAGLGIGDTIVAVDAREYSGEVLREQIQAERNGSAPIVMIVKKNGLFRTISVDYHGGLRYPHLVRLEGTPDRLAAIIAPHRSGTR